MTGSRVAGVFGRVPVEATMWKRQAAWQVRGFGVHTGKLCVATYVDNLFSVSHSLRGAISILDDFEANLFLDWGLVIKPSSRCCMASSGACQESPEPEKWPYVHVFNALGHSLTPDGSIRACWTKTRTIMWKAFWANSGSASASRLPLSSRLRLIDRGVASLLGFRRSRWPPQKRILAEVDSLQRKMIACSERLPRRAGEDVGEYCRRRGREAGSLARRAGLWSHLWCKRVVDSSNHLQRERNLSSWASRLLAYKGRTWLQQCRSSMNSASVHSGRTGTRMLPGRVHCRWHDGVDAAEDTLS